MAPTVSFAKKDAAAQVAPSAPALKASYRTAAAWNLFAMTGPGNRRWNNLSEPQKHALCDLVDSIMPAARRIVEQNS